MNFALFYTILYLSNEVLIHIDITHSMDFIFIIFVLLSAILIFNIVYLIDSLIKNKLSKKIIYLVLVIITQILFLLNLCIYNTFTTFFSLQYIFGMSNNVVNNFMPDVILAIKNNILMIILLSSFIIVYVVIFIIFNNFNKTRKRRNIILNIILIIAILILLPVYDKTFTKNKNSYNDLILNRGLVNAQYSYIYQDILFTDLINDNDLFNNDKYIKNEQDSKDSSLINDNISGDIEQNTISTDIESNNYGNISTISTATISHTIKNYDANVLKIDFTTLLKNETKEEIKNLHTYISQLEPTYKNEYTGIFNDKLLIQFTAEAFSPFFVNKEWTPTLYELINSSFVFDNFYAPNYGQSTIGGEFANLTGLLPLWFEGNTSANITRKNLLPFSFSNMTHKYTNNKVTAYHTGKYEYYNRPNLYKNWGFDSFIADGSGLEKLPKLDEHKYFYFDSGFIDLAFEEYLLEQKNKMENNEPFSHFYYMTISGHMPYNFDKTVTSFYKDIVNERYKDYSEEVRAYIASQYELEFALTEMMNIIKKNDMLDKVVICMATDHYPYGLSEDTKGDLYKEFAGFDYNKKNLEYYKSALIIYSSDIKNTHIDTPCSSIDITPTLLNLFGYDYDSRLLTGRDILDNSYMNNIYKTNIPIVYFPLLGDEIIITIKSDDSLFNDYAINVAKLKKNISNNIQKYNYYKYVEEYIK